MSPRTLRLALLIGPLLAGLACSDLAGPPAEAAPDVPVLVPLGAARAGAVVATPCETTFYHPIGPDAADGTLTVDILFGRPRAEATAQGPSRDELALVARHGGQVLHRFQVPAVRARMAAGRIPELVSDEAWVTVRRVPDPARMDAVVTVDAGRPVDDAVLAVFRALGGTVLEVRPGDAWFSGVLPDASIPALRGRLGRASVAPERVYCTLG